MSGRPTTVIPFQYRDNFTKFLLFYFEPGKKVLLQILIWLYVGQTPIESHLIHFKIGKADLNSGQKKTLQELQIGTKRLIDLDFTLLYALIQRVCGLAQKNDAVWDNRCTPNRKNGIEYMLYTLKTGRNELAHPGPEMEIITELDVQNKCNEIKILLTAILQKVGQIANVAAQEIDNVVDFVQKDLDRICKATNVQEIVRHPDDPTPQPTLKDLLFKEWRQHHDEQEENVPDFFKQAAWGVVALREASNVVSNVLAPIEDVSNIFQETARDVETIRELTSVASYFLPHVDDETKSALEDASKIATDVCAPLGDFLKNLAITLQK